MSANATTEPYTLIRLDRDGGPVAELVLNNPEKLNTMSPVFFEEIRRAFGEIETDHNVRVVVLWAEGRLFSAGLDLKSAMGDLAGAPRGGSKARDNLNLLERIKKLQDCVSSAEKCGKPVIAAIHGHCIGGGVDLTTACDIRLCSQDATFAIHETKIAIVADLGTLQRIARIVGKGMAREMAFTGKRIGAERALRCGLVNEVYPDKESLLAGARALAGEIAANSPLAVQGTKVVLNYSEQHTIDEGLDFVAQWNASFLHSRDLAEAITAFMEKRAPVFKGE